MAHVLYIDRFGNVQLDVEEPFVLEAGSVVRAWRLRSGRVASVPAYVRTFADVDAGELIVYADSYRRLAVAVNQGDAAARLDLAVDDELRIRLP